jgi:3-deoxy-D-manno-octulosonate 8-phosphate phosphatase (KDO 8-P phosphatase)
VQPAAGDLDPRLEELLSRVRLVALDVDGVLTDGRIVHGPQGESQSFCAHDGFAISALLAAGICVAWISGRGSPATERRAAELGVSELALRAGRKDLALQEIQERLGIAPEATASMGDDLPDLALRRRSACFAAPANARPEVLERADLRTRARGGAGAVRELAEHILRAQERWQAIVDAHGG